MLAAGRSDLFWQAHEQHGGGLSFSLEFKDLFTKMCALNPKQRLDCDEVLKHPWMQQDYATKAEIGKEFATRKQVVDDKIQKEKDQRRQERTKAQHNTGKIKVRRGHGQDEETCLMQEEDDEFHLEEVKLQVLPFD